MPCGKALSDTAKDGFWCSLGWEDANQLVVIDKPKYGQQ
jgi:hypothetical protein